MKRMSKLVVGLCAVVGSQFIVVSAVQAEAKAIPAQAITDGAEVRQAADDKSPSIATLKKGDSVTALDRKGSYWKVKLADGKEGFVSVTSLVTKGSGKDLIGAAAAPAAGAPAAKEPSAIDKAKASVNAKVDEVKGKSEPKKEPESKAKKLEKAANGLFKK